MAWATNVKTARDSYFEALGGAATGFDSSLTGAIDTYYNTMLEAQIARSDSHFDALHARYDALESAANDYSVASFNAAKEASLAYLDAAIKQAVDNAAAKKDIYEAEVIYYKGIAIGVADGLEGEMLKMPVPGPVLNVLPGQIDLGDLQDAIDNFVAWHADLKIAAAAATTANTAYGSYGATQARKTQAANAINTAVTTNETIRKATDKLTGATYKSAENTAWNTYITAAMTADVTYLTTYQSIENSFNTTKKNADAVYEATVIPHGLIT